MAAGPESELERAFARELERRLAELARCDDAAFGKIGSSDAVLVTLLFLLLPLIGLWLLA
jgi:hypothetical protein